MINPVISFLVTILLTPLWIKYAKRAGIIGTDLHKEEKKEVAEMGGIPILAGLFSGVFLSFDYELLPIALYLISVSFLGITDDLLKFDKVEKIILPGIPALILGFKNPLLMPYLFITSSVVLNWTNMLAGLNGLESGLGILLLASFSIISFLTKNTGAFLLSSCMMASLLAFLYYNRYPSRIFPGDCGTMLIGAVFFSVVYLTKVVIPAFIVLIPYLMDSALKFLSAGIMRREEKKPTKIKDGLLYSAGDYNSLIRVIISIRPMSEKKVVYCIWMIQTVFSLLGILSFLLLY
ncbi:MAG: multidrug transporter [Candidatus Hydrothermarchaeota archaeon]